MCFISVLIYKAIVVGVNLLTMVLETEFPDSRDVYVNMDWLFNVLYTVEAALRWRAA